MSSKNFDPILADYAFFEEHSTEAEADLAAYTSKVEALRQREGDLHILDFGCGAGNFTTRFLHPLTGDANRLTLCLLEPGAGTRAQAVTKLQTFGCSSLEAWDSLPARLPFSFDLILANHVLYYVSPLEDQLRKLIEGLAPGGRLMAAMACKENVLIQFWEAAFGAVGIDIPYHTGDDVEEALVSLKVPYRRENVPYHIHFPDSKANRLKILRFLLSEHLSRMPEDFLLSLFDPYVEKAMVKIATESAHFEVLNT